MIIRTRQRIYFRKQPNSIVTTRTGMGSVGEGSSSEVTKLSDNAGD